MYTPLNTHTHYSLLRAFAKPDQLAEKAKELGISSLAITDYNLSGCVEFFNECKKNGIKPILGLKVKVDNVPVTLIAMNLNGWEELVRLSTVSTMKQINFDELCENKNIIVILGEELTQYVIENKAAYYQSHPETYVSYLLIANYKDKISDILIKYKEIFGNRFFCGLNKLNESLSPIESLINKDLEYLANLHSVPTVALSNIYYTEKEHQKYHLIQLSCGLKTPLEILRSKLDTEEFGEYNKFFYGDAFFHFLSEEEMLQHYSKELLDRTNVVSDMCEEYNILSPPSLPKFNCPNGLTESEYLIQLCREGYKRVKDKIPQDKEKVYGDRVREELKVFHDAKLEGYFLIVQDYVNWVKNQGMLVGPCRGSSGGCLISYLLNITSLDPIHYNLFFSRFYNSGRIKKDEISFGECRYEDFLKM